MYTHTPVYTRMRVYACVCVLVEYVRAVVHLAARRSSRTRGYRDRVSRAVRRRRRHPWHAPTLTMDTAICTLSHRKIKVDGQHCRRRRLARPVLVDIGRYFVTTPIHACIRGRPWYMSALVSHARAIQGTTHVHLGVRFFSTNESRESIVRNESLIASRGGGYRAASRIALLTIWQSRRRVARSISRRTFSSGQWVMISF